MRDSVSLAVFDAESTQEHDTKHLMFAVARYLAEDTGPVASKIIDSPPSFTSTSSD